MTKENPKMVKPFGKRSGRLALDGEKWQLQVPSNEIQLFSG